MPDGERGSIYITTLFRDSAPLIRFNINDVSSLMPDTAACPCGCTLPAADQDLTAATTTW